MGQWLKFSSDRLVKLRIEPATPGLQSEQFMHYTTAAPTVCKGYQQTTKVAISKERVKILILVFTWNLLYSQTCLKPPLKNRPKKVLKINGSLMKVQSIAECSLQANLLCICAEYSKTCLKQSLKNSPNKGLKEK